MAVSVAAPASAITPFNVPGTGLWDHPFGSVFDTRSGLDLEATGIAFNQALYSGYEELSENRSDAWLGAAWAFVDRAEERRVGKEGVRKGRLRWSPSH